MSDKHNGMLGHSERIAITVGALAGGTVSGIVSATTAGFSGRIVTMRIWAQVQALTTLEGSQMAIGIANGQLTDAEISEKLLAQPSDWQDVPLSERNQRYARLLKPVTDPAADAALTVFVVDTGWTKLLLKFSDNEVLFRFFVYNWSTSTLTTGGLIKTFIECQLREDP